MNLGNLLATIYIVIVASIIPSGTTLAANAAGEIESIKGKVWVIDTKNKRRLVSKGDAVGSGELVNTSKRSAVSIRFKDQTYFALGPQSKMKIDFFKYSDKQKDNSIATKVIQGSFRFISGLISKFDRKAMRVNAGVVATISIRGTHVGGEVIPRKMKDGKVVQEESAKIVLLEPEKGNERTAIEVSNEYGSTLIDEHGYGTEIPDEHSAPSPARKMKIRTVNRISRALRNAARVPRI